MLDTPLLDLAIEAGIFIGNILSKITLGQYIGILILIYTPKLISKLLKGI